MPHTDAIQAPPAARRLLYRLNASLHRFARRAGRRARCTVVTVLLAIRQRWRRWRSDEGGSTTVQVVITDRRRGRALERTLHDGLRRLRAALGPAFPGEDAVLAVVVQQALATEQPLAGACKISNPSDGPSHVLIRLALTVGGHSLTDDELLAVLTEGVILATGHLALSETLVLPLVLPATPVANAPTETEDRATRPGFLAFHAGLAVGAASANGHVDGRRTPDARGPALAVRRASPLRA